MLLENEEFVRAELDFKYDYYKLDKDEFTTVRGKTKFEKFQTGQIVKITKRGQYLCDGAVFNRELKHISELSLAFLKEDGEYPGFTISSHQDFVDLVNSFRPPFYHQATVDSLMAVFYLIKVV